MALEPTQVNLQVQHFSHLIKDLALPLDRYTKPPPSGNMYSLSAQLKQLKTFEKRNECPVEEATSGESSPCQSDSEIESRSLMPDLQDVSNVLTEELSLEIDESLERLRDFNGKGISFVFENFDYHFRTHRLSGYIKDIRVSGCHSDKILSIRNIKEIVFAGSSSYHVEFSVRRPELLYEFIIRLQEYLRNETRRPIKIVRVLGDRRKRGQWNAVIIRNLQPRVTQKELETQCKREVVGPISVGTIVKIKDRFCCIVRCDYMEDAEAICKRLNNFLLKDPQTYEKYYFKAHLHPQSSLKHFSKERSIFSDYLKSSEKAGLKAPNKTGINDLLDMFQKSKKPTSAPPEKPKTQPQKEPSDKTQNGPTTGTDMLIKSISSSEMRETGAEASGLSMLIKSTSSIEMTSVETLVKSHSQKETKPSTAIEEEPTTATATAKMSQDTSKENIQEQSNKGLVITKAEDKVKRSRSKSPQGYKKPHRHDERSSNYQNRKSNAYDDKKYEKRTKRSKSRSKSSHSRSKSKSPSRRYKTEKSHKHRNGTETRRDSPHKSRSKDRKRHHRRSKSKSRSKSHSKSRSHSKHRHQKSSPGRKKTFMFEYKVNNSDSEKSRSKSHSKKIKKSRSKSKDRDRHSRYKNDYKTTSSYKSQYHDRRDRDDRGGYNDHHKSSYSRRDRSGSRHRDSYNADRKDYHYKGKDDYYERRKRDYDYDKDHRKGRRRSRSKDSRSKDKRSRSKSASHSRDRKRNSSTGRNGHRSTSRDRKTSHRNANPELKIEKNEGNKSEVATAKN